MLLTVTLVFSAGVVLAKNKNENSAKKEKMRGQLEAKDVKIYKKQKLSKEVKEKIKDAIKGKPASPPGLDKKDKDEPAGETATGILGEPVSGDRYAVVVGICDYPGTANDICLSDGDAWNMKNALVDVYGYDQGNIILLRDLNATFENIYNAVEDIKAQAGPNDEVVFFYSGHGTTARVNDGDKENIDEGLVVHDGTSLQFIWDGQLKAWFEDFAATRIAFVFDTCKAGGMDDVAKDGRMVVMSSQEKENSYVYSQGEYGEGFFSHYFVNLGMLQEMADGMNELKDVDGNVAVEESFLYAKDIVDYLQVPKMTDLFLNDLLL